MVGRCFYMEVIMIEKHSVKYPAILRSARLIVTFPKNSSVDSSQSQLVNSSRQEATEKLVT